MLVENRFDQGCLGFVYPNGDERAAAPYGFGINMGVLFWFTRRRQSSDQAAGRTAGCRSERSRGKPSRRDHRAKPGDRNQAETRKQASRAADDCPDAGSRRSRRDLIDILIFLADILVGEKADVGRRYSRRFHFRHGLARLRIGVVHPGDGSHRNSFLGDKLWRYRSVGDHVAFVIDGDIDVLTVFGSGAAPDAVLVLGQIGDIGESLVRYAALRLAFRKAVGAFERWSVFGRRRRGEYAGFAVLDE